MTIPTVIYAIKDFYLINELNEQIERLKAAGLIDYWHKKSFDEKSFLVYTSKYPKVIAMYHLYGCFQVWLIGLLISILMSFLEVGMKSLSRINEI